MKRMICRELTDEKIEEVIKVLEGLTAAEWGYITARIDSHLAKEALKIKIEYSKELDRVLKGGY